MSRTLDILAIDIDAALRKLTEKRFKNRDEPALALIRFVAAFSPSAIFVTLKKQTEELTLILGDNSAFEEDYGDIDRVYYGLWSSKGKLYLIVANPMPEAKEFSYNIPDIANNDLTSVKSLFEGDKKAYLEEKIFKLKMEPYDSGVYEIE